MKFLVTMLAAIAPLAFTGAHAEPGQASNGAELKSLMSESLIVAGRSHNRPGMRWLAVYHLDGIRNLWFTNWDGTGIKDASGNGGSKMISCVCQWTC